MRLIQWTQKATIGVVCAAALLPFAANAVQACYSGVAAASTPDEQFVVDSDLGLATDSTTGLTWMMCAAGLMWDSTTLACTDQANEYTWQEALAYAEGVEYAGFSDWRLPNIKELMSIVEYQCVTPSINMTIFSDGLSQRFWTNTPSYLTDGLGNIVGDTAWAVSFEEGSNNTPIKTDNSLIRLVRKSN